MSSDMYLRIKQVTTLTGLSRATIYNMMAVGSFPMKTALGVRAVGWLSSEIQIWMAERKLIEKQGGEAAPARRRASSARQPQTTKPEAGDQLTTMLDVGPGRLDGWEEPNASIPTPVETEAIRDRLRLLNTVKRQKGTPVKVSSPTISALPKGKLSRLNTERRVGSRKVSNVLDKKKT